MTSDQTTEYPAPLPWPRCNNGTDSGGSDAGCRGARLPGRKRCLSHSTFTEQEEYLSSLSPGAAVDHRGTIFDDGLLHRLLRVLTDPNVGQPHFGDTRFDEAVFREAASFNNAIFSARTSFDGATFGGTTWFVDAYFDTNASFNAATFTQKSWFTGVTFNASASFIDARFTGAAWFLEATFAKGASFNDVRFKQNAGFLKATFTENAWFTNAQFGQDAVFFRAQFNADLVIGPISCIGDLNLSSAVFGSPVTLEVAAATVTCSRTQWLSTATLRCRYATIDLTDAVLAAPLAVLTHSTPFTFTTGTDKKVLDELPFSSRSTASKVRVSSIRGVDATNLVLTDIDLTECIFSGAFHLDQLRLEGSALFATPPARRRRAIRYSRRSTLAEEHYWRARHTHRTQDWKSAPKLESGVAGPGQIAALYRALRIALESRGDGPGAADFYYGEMEMRRRDLTKPRAERALVGAYWLLSGYGLRASRAISWLFLAMIITVTALALWGQPNKAPSLTTTGTISGQTVTLHAVPTDPILNMPWSQRLTRSRIGQAVPIVLDAVLFRNTDQDLTPVGTYIDMAARILEPALLALAALAIRGRVKR